jgi:hypothetical protein
MTHPLSAASFAVRPSEVEALGAELAALAVDLDHDVCGVRSAAAWLPGALDGRPGWMAGATVTAWARLQEILAARAGALADSVSAATAAYRAEDAALAGRARSGPAPR